MEFDKNKKFSEIHDVLMDHLNENSSVCFRNNGKADIHIPENGYCSWWFDEIVRVTLRKGGLSEIKINKLLNNG